MQIIQGFLVAIVVTLGTGWIFSPVTWTMQYPLVEGFVIGIILGDPLTGTIAGAVINLAYLGWITAGGTMPGNLPIAGCYGATLTILAKADPTLAITFAVPISLLGILMWQLQMTINIIWVHRCDKYAAEGNTKMLYMCTYVFPQIVVFLVNGLPLMLLVMFGSGWLEGLVASIPESLTNALGVSAGLIPAVGIAMLLNFLGKAKLLPFFFIGFFASAYLGLGLMPIAIFGACMAVYTYMSNRDREAEEGELHPEVIDTSQFKIKLTKKDLVKHWLMGYMQEGAYNYERLQATGTCCAMIPLIKKLYTKEEDIKAALQRYMVFFNTEPAFIGSIIPGICASLEEQRANGVEITDETINGLRSSLMGPLAGIGDTVGQGIIYPILAALGCSMALDGSYAGPIIFIIGFPLSMLILGYTMYMTGYRQGKTAILKLLGSGTVELLTEAFSILGLMVVGAMGAERVVVNVPLTVNIGQTTIVLQEILDSIVLKLVPLATIMGTWGLMKKKVNTIWIIIGILVLGVVLAYLGVFSSAT